MSTGPGDWLRASGLPERWRGRELFVLLDTRFGRGERFLAAWQAWRADPERCTRLHVIALQVDAIEPAPASAGQHPGEGELATRLAAAWPPLTRNLHRLSFEAGRVVLLLAPTSTRPALRSLIAEVDAFCDDDPRATSEDRDIVHRAKAFARLAAPQATRVGPKPDPLQQRGWASAGFTGSSDPPSTPGLHLQRHAPTYQPRRAAARTRSAVPSDRHAVIVGAGLAGCAVAWALAEQGWTCTLLDRRDRIASEGSGNVAGLFHGIVNGQDGTHARMHRAAAWQACEAVASALRDHGVAGSTSGLLQLLGGRDRTAAMHDLVARLGLPPTYVQPLDATAASALAGVRLDSDAWFYPAGGWVDPAGLARAFLARAGSAARFRGGCDVTALRADGPRWMLLDAAGATMASASTVVLANAIGSARLAGVGWPLAAVRGQISVWPKALAAGFIAPRLPVTGSGYVLPGLGHDLVFGATTAADDLDPAVRLQDHRQNLAQLARLLPASQASMCRAEVLDGRTAWRCTSPDRLPLIGSVPLIASQGTGLADHAAALSQPRFVPRQPGLHVFTALGARGITWAAFGAQVLAAGITGAPIPLESDLVDAIDPARFLVRRERKARRTVR